MEQEDEQELLGLLKTSLGDMNPSNENDAYYLRKINQARNDLAMDDISENILHQDLGKDTIVVYATLLIQDKDIATNPTLLYLRNKLSDMTKGDRYSNDEW